MLKPQLVDISYARISTPNTSQLSSLGNQFKKLKDLNKGEVITHIGSGDDEFCDYFKNKILDIYNNKKDIRINIIAFDRLTRNFKDLDFLKRYVRYIYVLDENKTFDLKIELDQVALRIAKCVQELDTIRNRFMRNTESRKRKREETDNLDLKLIGIKKRYLSVYNNMRLIGVSDEKIKELEKFIRISQNLDTLKKWNDMFSLMENLGLSKEEIKKTKNNYCEYINKNNNYYILKSDLIDFVSKIIKNYLDNNSNNNHIFINHFVNSNIRLANLL